MVQDDHTQQVVRNIQVCRIHCALFQIAKPTVVMVIIAHQTKRYLRLKRHARKHAQTLIEIALVYACVCVSVCVGVCGVCVCGCVCVSV